MWRRWLSHPFCFPVLALIGILIVAPASNSGLLVDDFVHWSRFQEGFSVHQPGSFWGLFSFMDGIPAHITSSKASGDLIWWAAEDLRVNFWRPLSELSHWLDYRLWPDSPVLMHVHNLLWYGALILLLGRFYQAHTTQGGLADKPSVLAGLATLIFTLSCLHLTPVMWVAARNQLISGCFTLLCLTSFHRWHSERANRQGWLAALYLLLSLLSAEAGVSTLGYLVAYVAIMLPGRSWGERLRILLPFLLIVVGWRACYNALHFGATASGYYVDPVNDPARFGNLLLLRLPSLIMAQLVGLPSAALTLMPHEEQWYYAAAICVLALLYWQVAQAYEVFKRPLMRYLAVGALLSVIPMCASEPSDRLLMTYEFGMSMLVAVLLVQVLKHHREHKGWLALGGKALVGLALLAHFVVFPVQGVASATLRKQISEPTAVGDPLSLPDPRLSAGTHVILINPPVAAMNGYLSYVRRYYGRELAPSTQALVNGDKPVTLRIVDPYTIEITSSGQRGFYDNFTRDLVERPFKVGHAIQAGIFEATVTQLSPAGLPLATRFTFKKPLNDQALAFYTWTDDRGFVPYQLPAAGQVASMPGVDLADLVKKRLTHGQAEDPMQQARMSRRPARAQSVNEPVSQPVKALELY
jgi:hypothetical protein